MLTFDVLPAGNYYVEMSQPKGQIGWWGQTGNVFEGGRAYANAVAGAGDRTLVFMPVGEEKPVVLSPSPPKVPQDPTQIVADIKNFFTFRSPQPDYFEGPRGPGDWGWLEVFPQHIFYKTPGVPEQMTVGVAQNALDGKLSVLSNPRSHGRSFHNGKESDQQDFTGHNFAEQWKRALEVNPPFVFVTGWNEWIAGRFGLPSPFHGAGPVSFVDEFNTEYSRDIEPMKGGHGDAYYYQLVSYMRRFKGARPAPLASAPQTLKIGDGFAKWQNIKPEYRDDRFDNTHRDSPGWAKDSHMVNKTGRNDLVVCKVARDARNLYFYVRTREPITTSRAPEWMQLFIDIDQDAKTGWQGFDYAINRTSPGLLEKYNGKGQWQTVARVPYAVARHEMELACPRSLLARAGSTALHFDFKWMDNTNAERDMLNLYVNGDTAPNGRFKYRFQTAP